MWGTSPELIPDWGFLLHVITEKHHCQGLLQTSDGSINIRGGCRKCVAVDCGEVSEMADEHDLGSCAFGRGGSNPPFPTQQRFVAHGCYRQLPVAIDNRPSTVYDVLTRYKLPII